MNAAPRVSVIMPFLDLERYLAESVESVLAQTYEHWELLLVDDGSTDASPGIARDFARRYPGVIRYLTHPEPGTRGASAARNRALEAARGEYIALLDGDDVWLPHKLEQQVALLDGCPEAGLVYGNTQWWYSWNTADPQGAQDWTPPLGFPPQTLVQPPELLRRFMAGKAAVPATCSVLIRRSAVEEAGGFEEEFRQVFTDHAFYTKLLLRTPALVTDACWDRYRRRRGSSYSVIEDSSEFVAQRRAWLHWTREYLARHGWGGTGLWETVEQQLARYEYPRLGALETYRRRLPRRLEALARGLGRRLLPRRIRRWLRVHWLPRWRPRPGEVDFGSLARVTPLRRLFDPERGTPIDGYYIQEFLEAQDPLQSPMLWLGPGVAGAGVNASMPAPERMEDLASDSVATVVLVGIPPGGADLEAVLRQVRPALKPGGRLLAALPAIARFGPGEATFATSEAYTLRAVRRAAEEVFGGWKVRAETRGNILTACAWLHGLAAEEIGGDRLGYRDPSYPVLILLQATRGTGT